MIHGHISVLDAVAILEECCMPSADMFYSGEQIMAHEPFVLMMFRK